MKKITFLLIFTILSSTYIVAQTPIDGVWNTGKDNTKINITEENSIWTGKTLSSDNENAKIGTVMLKDLEKKGKTWHGKLFFAKKNVWYNVKIQPNGDQLELTIKVGFISKTITWER